MGKINGTFKYILIIVFFLWSNISSVFGSECSKPVQAIQEGEKANCSGFLFDKKTEEAAYKATRIVELQEKENQILEKRLELYVKQSEALAKELAKKKNTEEFVRVFYFIGGALITGIVARNVNR